ncbi:MAG: hypothetical protein OHK0046_13610 [Anaerolineae bacterium]
MDSITTGYTVTSGLPLFGLSGPASPVTVTVQCDAPGTTPENGTLVLTTNESGLPTYTYDLICEIPATPTPTNTTVPTSTPSTTSTTDPGVPTATPTATNTIDPGVPTATSTVTATLDPSVPTGTPTATATLDPSAPTPTATATVTTTPLEGLDRIAPAENAVIDAGGEYVSQFQWAAVDGAAWYHVFISTTDFSQIFFDKWYQAADVCSGSTCTTTDHVWLVGNGEVAWWMTYWNETIGADYTNLYDEAHFTLSLPQPGVTTGTAPTGDVSGTITLQWNVNPNALWYQVWAGPADYSDTAYLQWVNGAEVCSGGMCSVNLGVLDAGDYEFWLQAWNPAGQTDWAQMTSFTVTP